MAAAFSHVEGPDGFVSAEDGRNELEKSGLPLQKLGEIWDLSDLDCDGRLSRREFACALLLASMALRGLPLPLEITPEQQVALVEFMDNRLAVVSKGHVIDDWSVFDTAATAPRQQHRALDKSKRLPKASKTGPEEDPLDPAFSSAGHFSQESAALHLVGGEFESTPALYGTHEARDCGAGSRGRLASPRSQKAAANNANNAPPLQASVFGTKGVLEPSIGHSGVAGESHFDAALRDITRLGAPEDMERLGREALQERREMARQLARRRDSEQRLRDSHRRLEELARDHCAVQNEAAYTRGLVAQRKDELGHLLQQVSEAESFLAMLRSSCGPEEEDVLTMATGGVPLTHSGRTQAASLSLPGDDGRIDMVISKVRAERELLHSDKKAVDDTRRRLAAIARDIDHSQVTQQALLERQRQTDQDRTRAICAIEAERSKLSALCQERVQIWEARLALERDVASLSAGWQAIRSDEPGTASPVPASGSAVGGRPPQHQRGGIHEPRPTAADAAAAFVPAGFGYPGSGPGQGHGLGRAAAPGRGAPGAHQDKLAGVPVTAEVLGARVAHFGNLNDSSRPPVASVH